MQSHICNRDVEGQHLPVTANSAPPLRHRHAYFRRFASASRIFGRSSQYERRQRVRCSLKLPFPLLLPARCSLQASPVKAGGTASAFLWSPAGGVNTQWTVSC